MNTQKEVVIAPLAVRFSEKEKSQTQGLLFLIDENIRMNKSATDDYIALSAGKPVFTEATC